MKKKNLTKKLKLEKQTIVNLNSNEMKGVVAAKGSLPLVTLAITGCSIECNPQSGCESLCLLCISAETICFGC